MPRSVYQGRGRAHPPFRLPAPAPHRAGRSTARARCKTRAGPIVPGSGTSPPGPRSRIPACPRGYRALIRRLNMRLVLTCQSPPFLTVSPTRELCSITSGQHQLAPQRGRPFLPANTDFELTSIKRQVCCVRNIQLFNSFLRLMRMLMHLVFSANGMSAAVTRTILQL